MKVLHLIDSGGLYGAERMLLALVAEQIKQGLEPMILSAGYLGEEEKAIELEAKRLGLPILEWRMSPGLNIKEALKIIKWSENNKISVLHSHGYKFDILVVMSKMFKKRIPFVTTIHGYVGSKRFSRMWVYETLDKLVLPYIDRVCVVSSRMLDIPFIKRLKSEKKYYVGNGIGGRAIKYSNENIDVDYKYNFMNKKFNIISVGRLSPEKNFSTLIEAMADHRLEQCSVGLTIIGEGGLKRIHQNQISELGLENRVNLLGYRDDVAEIMHHADLLIMPSLTEGMPITLLEAMREGLPILASSVGSIPDVLEGGSAGFLLRATTDAKKLASEILLVVKDDIGRKQKSERAELIFQKNYSSKNMADNYLKIYESLSES